MNCSSYFSVLYRQNCSTVGVKTCIVHERFIITPLTEKIYPLGIFIFQYQHIVYGLLVLTQDMV